MTLEDLGNLGDFLGGIAVIATLVYLAVQIRQNTRMLRQSTEQMFRSDSTAVVSLMAHSAENAAVYRKGLTHPDQLTRDERTHFFLLMTVNFYHLAQGHLAYLNGAQSEVTWESQRLAVKFFASQPGARSWWKQEGNQLIPRNSEFWHLVDSEMQQHAESAASNKPLQLTGHRRDQLDRDTLWPRPPVSSRWRSAAGS